MLYFTPKRYPIYICIGVDNRIVLKYLSNPFDTFKKWQILLGRYQNFPKCHGFDSQHAKQ